MTTEIHHDGRTLELSGDLDVRSTWEVRAAVYQHIDAHAGDVAVDLTGVGAIDLTALRVLAVATRRAHAQGKHLRLRGCGPAVRRMLHLSGLYRAFEVERAARTA